MKKTISFVEAVSQKDRALQTCIRAFSIIRYGGTLTPDEAKIFIDLCSLALPNKYRFPRELHETMERQVKEIFERPSRTRTREKICGNTWGLTCLRTVNA